MGKKESENELLKSQIALVIEQNKLLTDQIKLLKAKTEPKETVKKQTTKKEKKIPFASSNECFKLTKLQKLIEEDFDQANKYISEYYAVLLGGKGSAFIHWDAFYEEFIELDDTALKVHLPAACDRFELSDKGKPIKVYSAYDFIKSKTLTRYRYICDYNNGRVFEKDGELFINKFNGFLHKDRKPYKSYPKEIKKYVVLMWNHIKEVWCSDSEEQFIYTKTWIQAMVSGQKMTSALYLRSAAEGTGKTITM